MAISASQVGKPGAPAVTNLVTSLVSGGDIRRVLRFVILSAPGKGKTHLLATGSRKYREPWPTETVMLDDLYVLAADLGGMLCLREKNFDAPMLDISEWKDSEVFAQLETVPRFLASEVEARKTRLLGVDTVDAILGAVLNVLSDQGLEGPKLYNAFAAEAGKFLRGMAAIKCPVVFNAHVAAPKVKMRSGAADNTEYLEQAALAAGADTGILFMDIGGAKAARALRNAATLTGHLKVTELPGGKESRMIDFYDERVESKRRLTECVGKTAPANWSDIFAKIAAGMNAPEL